MECITKLHICFIWMVKFECPLEHGCCRSQSPTTHLAATEGSQHPVMTRITASDHGFVVSDDSLLFVDRLFTIFYLMNTRRGARKQE